MYFTHQRRRNSNGAVVIIGLLYLRYTHQTNTANEAMEMTIPVVTRRSRSGGETMDMTTPVITTKTEDQDKWRMSFVMPSKYGSNLPQPKNSAVTIKEVPGRTVAVVAFSDVSGKVLERQGQIDCF